ncbi:probable Putative nicotinamide N-methyltransferase [Cephalotrichum gorgonifer]|uniref:Protein N-terminal and lysine N-methyltransferase EFM7 n=1 Tax=Cephalotrichum gorgonifer TaxID=2041049 RepID=A0AAE8SXQ0_9PEZI|nr:probable Putative nicotinamide N-methyltransferase [Cephalotrichum gorgonifer]
MAADDASMGDLFADPEDYYPPTPPPKTEFYTLSDGRELTLHLVGHSPLEAHHLWNGSRVVSELFEREPERVRGKTVLELGAGAGLPSLVCGALEAERVVLTDFPDADLVEVMQKNVDGLEELVPEARGRVRVKGFIWGGDVKPLAAELGGAAVEGEGQEGGRFDVLVLADLLFRHSEHGNMVKTIREALRRGRESTAYVVFTSYRPWLQHKDLAFFDLAREAGFVVEKLLEKKLDAPLFENDPGDLEVQKTVTGWTVRWPEEACRGAAH